MSVRGSWISRVQKIKPAAARYCVSEAAYQFLWMVLADSQEIENVFIQVIQNLDARGLFPEEKLSPAAKRFNVTSVFEDQGDDFAGEPVFAAHV